MNKFERKYFNTQKKLCDALITLLNEKEFTYITIKEICVLSCVNRSTFYLHYDNTAQLLEDTFDLMNESFNEYFKNSSKDEILSRNEESLFLITDEYLMPYLSFIRENRNLYKAMKKNNLNVTKSYEEMYKNVFYPILSKFNCKESYKRYIMDYYMQGISSIILTWCDNECDLENEEVCEIIKLLIKK